MHKSDTKLISAWDIPLALVLLTRLPVPRLPDAVFDRQAAAVWAFPVVGLIIGVLACVIGWAAMGIGLPAMASALLVVAVLVVATGAMHEDGLADTFDGFWGGFSPERRLEIMKDSQIGTYGVLALLFSQFLRIVLIAALLAAQDSWAIVAACLASRAFMPVLMAALPNARKSGLSHSVGAPGAMAVSVGAALAVLGCLILTGFTGVVALVCASIVVAILASVAKAKIGGQTGDVLGASQQLSELSILVVAVCAL